MKPSVRVVYLGMNNALFNALQRIFQSDAAKYQLGHIINPASWETLSQFSSNDFIIIDDELPEQLYNQPASEFIAANIISPVMFLRKSDSTFSASTLCRCPQTQKMVVTIDNQIDKAAAKVAEWIQYNKNLIAERDVHQQLVETQQAIGHMKSQMIQQEKLASIGQLAAGIAHEINNPLGFISSNFTTLKDYITIIKRYMKSMESLLETCKPAMTPEQDAEFEAIQALREKEDIDFLLDDTDDIFKESVDGFERMMSLIQNLKNFSRFNHEIVDEYDVNKALESTLTVARNEIKYVAQVDKQFETIPTIACRGDEINQVFLNILVNAAQAIKSQKRSELGTIHIQTCAENNHVTIKIADNGPGIPETIIDKIYEPFFTTKAVGKGTGLGLHISHEIIVDHHKGKLLVESEVDKGTTFTIDLPLEFVGERSENDIAG
ncbi:histidine kinase [candidate division KSB1 bacterium]|nr:histidine kinase [candidate division KSB1 bacterium]